MEASMAVIVITGSTRGIGLGLARSFLERSHQVVISGRSEASVERALAALDAGDATLGVPCEVTEEPAVQALWDAAVARFGRVDHWINNAGIVNPPTPLAEQRDGEYAPVVAVNLTGTMHGCAVAMRGMAEQEGGGCIWNMKGLGSDGRFVDGSTPYATTKYAITYLTKALVREVKGTRVRVGSIQPGMVVTDLLTGSLDRYPPEERARVERIFDILADRVETVCPWLVERILSSDRNGAEVNWLTPGKLGFRFLLSPFRERGVMREA
jgi:NAD(P)-dependent dehydrogenase (short-subunit alcohol dehydrogenase family)